MLGLITVGVLGIPFALHYYHKEAGVMKKLEEEFGFKAKKFSVSNHTLLELAKIYYSAEPEQRAEAQVKIALTIEAYELERIG